jgi:hypothetical protein
MSGTAANLEHPGTVSRDAPAMIAGAPRTYSFSIAVTVDADDPAYDDPEWVADAAAGALTNVYGYDCLFDDIVDRIAPAENSST